MTLGIDPADWPRISDLLDEALEIEPPLRAGWLDSLAGVGARHRETLARLLAKRPLAPETRGFLSRAPVFSPGSDEGATPGEPGAGSRVGDYRLVSLLGQGGMGTVWLADRVAGEPRRRVALKLPHVGWDPRLVAGLERERDILATLEHPRIARLYDAGVDASGRPFLAMEHVDGEPIDAFVRRHACGVEATLRLVLQVVDAVGYAHARLVVHRDLKPTNILVTPDGEVRLLDFGIARLLDDGSGLPGEPTEAVGRVMTTEYASPEQIRGERVDTASDVYGLGVVVHELLTGARPVRFRPRDAVRWAHDADAAEPPPASSVAPAERRRALAGDLDAILAQALRKARADRYPNVVAFGDDLRRHLANQPVHARPDGALYRARKFVRRHAVSTAAVVGVAAAVLLGAGVSLWQAREARLQATRADEVKRYAISIFQSADTAAGNGPATTAVALLLEAERRIEREIAGKPEMRVELLTAIGDSLGSQDRGEDAVRVLRRAVAIGGTELGAAHPRTVAATVVLGQTLVLEGDGMEGPRLLAEAAQRAARIDAHADRATALSWLALAQLRRGETDAAVEGARAATEVASRAAPDDPVTASAWVNDASTLASANRPGAAEAARRGVALLRSRAGGDRLDNNTLSARLLLANGLSDEGRVREGLQELETLHAEAVALLGAEHPKIAFVASSLGRRRLEAGDEDGAVAAFRDAVAIELRNPARAFDAATVQQRLGDALLAAGRPDEAIESYDAARTSFEAAASPPPRLGFQISAGRAAALTRLGRLDEADRALASLSVEGSPTLALVQSLQSDVRQRQGRTADALDLASRAAPALAGHPSPAVRFAALLRLGEAQLAAGRPAEAAETLAGALEQMRARQLRVSRMQASAAAAMDTARAMQAASPATARASAPGAR